MSIKKVILVGVSTHTPQTIDMPNHEEEEDSLIVYGPTGRRQLRQSRPRRDAQIQVRNLRVQSKRLGDQIPRLRQGLQERLQLRVSDGDLQAAGCCR